MPDQWQEVLRRILGAFLEGQAIDSESLDTTILEGVSQTSRPHLPDPMAMDLDEKPMGFIAFLLTPF